MEPRSRSKLSAKTRARIVVERLAELFPGSAKELCALEHDNPFQLLVATILSAQTTDERVNIVTPALFARYPGPEDLAGAEPSELEELIRTTGFFRQKAKALIGMARGLVERFDSAVPTSLEDLVTLPGVGRKTANVVRSVDFALPGLPVDTHVRRLAGRLGFTRSDDPDVIERELGALVPEADWGPLSLRLILHGRTTCLARKPKCSVCALADVCPSAGTFDVVAPKSVRKQAKAAKAR